MKGNSIKSLVLALAFTLTLFAGATQTLAKTNDMYDTEVTTVETKLTGVENARENGGKANAYGTSEDKLTGTENAQAQGGNAYAGEKEVEEVETEPTALEVVAPVLKGTENAKAKGGKANAYGKSETKLTGIENARAHGGNAYAYADDEVEVDAPAEDEAAIDTAVIIAEVIAEVDTDLEVPELTGIENARANGGKAYAYGHSKIKVLNTVQ